MDENTLIEEEETSIIADRLLSYQEIEAVFVLAKVSKDKYKLSARSNEGINVQLICESLGGGGHFNSSAAA
jgi:c-di-AMP phosphodiesterase-like protein